MADTTDYLTAVRAAVAENAREVERQYRIVLPGYEVPAGEWPESVRSAQDFHNEVLQHGELGSVLVHRLPAEMGSGFLLISHHSESRWGVAEAYSPRGELWAAGVYIAHAVAWHDLEVVRQAARDYRAPLELIPKSPTIDWITLGTGATTAYESVGGRFLIAPGSPQGQPNCFTLIESATNTMHTFDTLEAAQAKAMAILTES